MKIAKIYFLPGNSAIEKVVNAGLGKHELDPRSNTSEVLVFDPENADQILALKTGISPGIMAFAVKTAIPAAREVA